jgi:hypothetical protein
VLLGRDLSVKPLVAYRAEALDVYRSTELYTYTTEREGSNSRATQGKKKKDGKRERFTLSVCRDVYVSERRVGYRRRGVGRRWAYLVEAHRPALKDLIPPGELRKYARKSERVL